MAWCKAGIIEGNNAHNVTYGVFQQTTNAQDIVIRNNWFKNVIKGVVLGNIDTESPYLTGSLTTAAGNPGYVGTVTTTAAHNLSVGDQALLSTTGGGIHNGVVVTVTAVTTYTFQFGTANPATGGTETVSHVQRVFGVGNFAQLGSLNAPGGLIIEGNVVELSPETSLAIPIGVHLADSRSFPPQPVSLQDPLFPAYVYSNVIVRDNKIRYRDGFLPPQSGFLGYPMQLNSAADLLVRNNVIESAPTPAIQNDRCGSVSYFNNQTPAGVLIQGVNGDNKLLYEELTTLADLALVLSFFNRKS